MQLGIVGSSVASQQVTSVRSLATDQVLSWPSDQESTSGPAELFKKLEALATSDPEKFKEVTAQMAAKVEEAAEAATDPNEKKMLTELAAKLTDASQTGDVSGLKPPEGGGPPPGPPPSDAVGGGGSKGEVSSAAASGGAQEYDSADTNEDGTVSIAEQAAFEAKRASLAEQAYSRTMDEAREGRARELFSSLEALVDAA